MPATYLGTTLKTVIAAIATTLLVGFGVNATIDASSKPALQASYNEMVAELPESVNAEEFQEGYKTVATYSVMKTMTENPGMSDEEANAASIAKVQELIGEMNAKEVIAKGEELKPLMADLFASYMKQATKNQ